MEWTPALDVELGVLTQRFCFDFDAVAESLGSGLTEEDCRLRWAMLDEKADVWRWTESLDEKLLIFTRKCLFDFSKVAIAMLASLPGQSGAVTADMCRLRYTAIDKANVEKRKEKSSNEPTAEPTPAAAQVQGQSATKGKSNGGKVGKSSKKKKGKKKKKNKAAVEQSSQLVPSSAQPAAADGKDRVWMDSRGFSSFEHMLEEAGKASTLKPDFSRMQEILRGIGADEDDEDDDDMQPVSREKLLKQMFARDGQECPESLLKNDLGDFAAFYEKAMGGMR
eukprot:g1574.t1